MKKTRFNAFTMAEILLSLTIIGVVAAITLPSLMGNINERTWNTQRKALHARMSQALAMMPQLNGYNASESTLAAETFITEGLSKVIKINNICDKDNLDDCGLSTIIYGMTGSQVYSAIPSTHYSYASNWAIRTDSEGGNVYYATAAFETQNGESVLTFYNPYCSSKPDTTSSYQVSNQICANFIYDLNGNKGPNTVGKDIGYITALYATDSAIVAPMPAAAAVGGIASAANQTVGSACTAADPDSRAPSLEEAIALALNNKLHPLKDGNIYFSSTSVDATRTWSVQNDPDGDVSTFKTLTGAKGAAHTGGVVCVKR